MKIIGYGWQYTVYDMGNGRVLKKYNTRFFSYFVFLKDCFPYFEHPVWKFSEYYERCRKEAIESIKKVSYTTIEKWMLANPLIHNEDEYEQDLVTSLRTCISCATPASGRKIIDDFVIFNKTLINKSFVDRNFNITDNFGMNIDGNIVLIDLGEICSDRKIIYDYLTKRPWASSDVIDALPYYLRSYFIKKMDEAFLF